MATETAEGLSAHVRGVTVTTLACVAGIAAAVASFVITDAGASAEAARAAATNQQALYALVASILVQFPILHVLGVSFGDLGAKDYLYITFMTFALWFVAWGILLTAVGL